MQALCTRGRLRQALCTQGRLRQALCTQGRLRQALCNSETECAFELALPCKLHTFSRPNHPPSEGGKVGLHSLGSSAGPGLVLRWRCSAVEVPPPATLLVLDCSQRCQSLRTHYSSQIHNLPTLDIACTSLIISAYTSAQIEGLRLSDNQCQKQCRSACTSSRRVQATW